MDHEGLSRPMDRLLSSIRLPARNLNTLDNGLQISTSYLFSCLESSKYQAHGKFLVSDDWQSICGPKTFHWQIAVDLS